ncbi:hypothetical protein V5N11_012626 [Cardamine amara subsp. amara]|uniref:Uncharacterized protein n=1 Tax=Cardamine amara subsp. amara TaxID=228776 RepID=A0ABD1B3W3_CARAN
MGRRSSGGGRSYSTGSSWSKSRSFSKKSSPKPTKDKDEKAPPPAKVDTTHGGSRRLSFADGIYNLDLIK